MTTKGLFQNVEASICVSYKNDDEQGQQLKNSILNQYNGIISGDLGCTQALNRSLLDLLVANNIVLPEISARKARSTANKQLPKVPVSSSKELEEVRRKSVTKST